MMTPDGIKVWSVLRHHVGEAAAVSADAVAATVGLRTGAEVRRVVRENYSEFAGAVAGTGSGLYIVSPADATAAEAANHYIARLVHHAGEIHERRRLFEAKLVEMGFRRTSGGDYYLPVQRALFDTTGSPN